MRDEERDKRIYNEIIVDAYDEIEQALSWYYYLEEHLKFPFMAKCVLEISISPLKLNETVKVIGMPSEDDCMEEVFVLIELMGRTFGVPLSQLRAIEPDEDRDQAIEDWHYWNKKW